jgi:mono/diheme cytochrome c family protein
MAIFFLLLFLVLCYGQEGKAGREEEGSCARCHTDRMALKASLSPPPERVAGEEES